MCDWLVSTKWNVMIVLNLKDYNQKGILKRIKKTNEEWLQKHKTNCMLNKVCITLIWCHQCSCGKWGRESTVGSWRRWHRKKCVFNEWDCELIIKKQNMVIITYLTKHLSWAQLHHLIDWWGAQIHPSNFFHFTRAKHGRQKWYKYLHFLGVGLHFPTSQLRMPDPDLTRDERTL